jgi:hypothetical protein
MTTKESTNTPQHAQFERAITPEELEEGLRVRDSWMPVHRLALMVMTRGSDEFTVTEKDTAETFLEGVDQLTQYLRWRECETEILETARARMLALCQEWFPDAVRNMGYNGKLRVQYSRPGYPLVNV